MRIGTPGFIPSRLTEARAARRIPTKSALARELSINPSTVSRWEDGTSSPDSEALTRLAEKFGVRVEFFLRPSFDDGRPMFLRSLSSTLVRDLDYQRVQMKWLQEISSVLEHYVDFPELNIPNFMRNISYKQLREEDLESIAIELRKYWNLGEGPCSDIVDVLEKNGFIIASIEMGTSKLDGLCSWSPVDGRPHILLANDKMSFARRQMDAAHEMAHALLHSKVTPDELKQDLKLIESQAFRLASAFLLPSTSYPMEVRSATLAGLVPMKERWRVSIKAQIRRLLDLKIIDKDYGVHMYKIYSGKGWSRLEPMDDVWIPAEPALLKDAIYLIVGENIRSKNDLMALEFAVSAGDVENLCNLPAGWFSAPSANVVSLKPESKGRGRPSFSEVIPFSRKI